MGEEPVTSLLDTREFTTERVTRIIIYCLVLIVVGIVKWVRYGFTDDVGVLIIGSILCSLGTAALGIYVASVLFIAHSFEKLSLRLLELGMTFVGYIPNLFAAAIVTYEVVVRLALQFSLLNCIKTIPFLCLAWWIVLENRQLRKFHTAVSTEVHKRGSCG
jgi:hypothetical protein